MIVVTRFPPSPTGFMHIGNARTALFNWLYARHHGGKFVLRIEDTDRKRHSEEAVEAITSGMKWLGLNWDGDVTSQFENQARHAEIAQTLLDQGHAYHCYCTPEELDEMRSKAKEEGKPTFYDRRWRDKKPEDAPKGMDPVVRIKAPLEGETTIHDLVQGDVKINHSQLDDFIILRSDKSPTYMLSVVVDDHDMGITHILRGDDHLNNAFRQKVIFDAMGWNTPEFAHLPLIHGSDGGKFAKRHGAQSVEEYRDMGYLPEAMCNYLLRLGWGHGDDEIIPTEKAIELFDIKGIGKSAAKFDFAKLESLNAHYMQQADGSRLYKIALPFYQSIHNIEPDDTARQRIITGSHELKQRAKTMVQFAEESVFYAKSLPLDYDEKAKNNLNTDTKNILEIAYVNFKELSDFKAENIQSACKDIADQLCEGKLGKVGMPLRAALTGRGVSPSIFHAAEILGKDETLARIQAAIETI